MSKFKIGDNVRVVKFGSPLWCSKLSKDPIPNLPKIGEDNDFIVLDMSRDLVGQFGVVDGVSSSGSYSLVGVNGKSAWYIESQLELITNQQ